MNWLAGLVVISFFAPVLVLGTRHIFLADPYCWLLALSGLVWFFRHPDLPQAGKRHLAKFLVLCGGLLLVFYLHGYFRPVFVTHFLRNTVAVAPENEVFQPGHEFVAMFRFWIWLAACALMAVVSGVEVFQVRVLRSLRFTLKTIAVCLLFESVLMAIAHWSPAFHGWLGRVYQYNVLYDTWFGREYGTFPSPVEAGISMGLGGLIVLASGAVAPGWMVVAMVGACAGLVLSKTATAMASFLMAVLFVLLGKRLRAHPLRILGFGASGVVLLMVVGLLGFPALFHQKMIDVLGRTWPWRLQLTLIFSRPDLAFFGLGFVSLAADNMLVFVLARGGLLGAAAVALAGGGFLRRYWPTWIWRERGPLIFLLVSAMLFDVLVYRNVVYLMIAAGIPLLVLRLKTKGFGPG